MSHKFWSLNVVVAGGLALSLPGAAAPVQDARAAITAAYASMDRAFARRDLPATMAHFDPGVVTVDEYARQTDGKDKVAAQFRQAFASSGRAGASLKVSTRLLTFSLEGGGAVATTRADYTTSGTQAGVPFVHEDVRYERDYWIKAGRRWRIRREQTTGGGAL